MAPESRDDQSARHTRQSRLRASHADREQVIDTLKDAFVQDRLTKDEFDGRVSHALASRTYADLAALTADLPAGPPAARPPRRAIKPRPGNTTIKVGVHVIAASTVLTGGLWAGALLSQADNPVVAALVSTVTFIWLGIVIFAAALMLESRHQKRSGGQLPPAAGDRGQATKRSASAGPGRSLRPGDYPWPHSAEASWRPIPLPLVPLPPGSSRPGWSPG